MAAQAAFRDTNYVKNDSFDGTNYYFVGHHCSQPPNHN